MKKTKAVIAALILAITMAMPTVALAQPTPEEAGLIPIRAFFEDIGGIVEWQYSDESIHIAIDGGTVVLFARQTAAYTNGVATTLQDGVSLWQDRAFISEDDLMLLMLHFIATIASDNEPQYAGEIARTDFWVESNFTDTREPMFSTDLAHGQIATGYIEFINDNLYSRSSFTYREKETAIWIVQELLAMGHDWHNIEVQEFTHHEVREFGEGALGISWDAFATPPILGGFQLRETRLSQNVILTVPGQNQRTIIVGAHYDTPHYNAVTFTGYQYGGASDNASGTALLLESAQRILEQDNYYTIVYVFFGAEEVGLLGAHFYHESLTQTELDNIVMMVNADVLIEGPYLFFGTGVAEEFGATQMEALAYVFAYMFEMPVEEMHEILPMILATMSPEALFILSAQLGLIDVESNSISQQVDAIALEVIAEHDIDLISEPWGIYMSSDQLIFVNAGHTVVSLFSLESLENRGGVPFELSEGVPLVVLDYFTLGVSHSTYDNFHHIEYTRPGFIENAMRTFSLFLEAILLNNYS